MSEPEIRVVSAHQLTSEHQVWIHGWRDVTGIRDTGKGREVSVRIGAGERTLYEDVRSFVVRDKPKSAREQLSEIVKTSKARQVEDVVNAILEAFPELQEAKAEEPTETLSCGICKAKVEVLLQGNYLAFAPDGPAKGWSYADPSGWLCGQCALDGGPFPCRYSWEDRAEAPGNG